MCLTASQPPPPPPQPPPLSLSLSLSSFTPCIRVPKFSAGAPVKARPSRSRQKQSIDLGKLYRFTSNVGIAPLTDHHGWNGDAFPCPVVSISWHLVSCTPHNQHFHFWFRLFAGKIALSLKWTGKRNHLVHFDYCHYVIKYLMREMMNYHCLRVFRSRVRRIGKHSPRFSVFRTRVHGCSDAELCRVSIQRTVGAIFLLGNYWISIGHARQVINEVWRFRVTESSNVNLIELLRQFSPSGYITHRRNKDIFSCPVV